LSNTTNGTEKIGWNFEQKIENIKITKKSFSKDKKSDILLEKKNWERKGVLGEAGSTFFLTVTAGAKIFFAGWKGV